MKNISLDITKATQFLAPGAVEAYEPKAKAAQAALENGMAAPAILHYTRIHC